jgi:uncharacterized protein
MRGLAIAGTAAMFLVGGGILSHGIPGLEAWFHHLAEGGGRFLEALGPMFMNALVGVIAGAIAVGIVQLVRKVRA